MFALALANPGCGSDDTSGGETVDTGLADSSSSETTLPDDSSMMDDSSTMDDSSMMDDSAKADSTTMMDSSTDSSATETSTDSSADSSTSDSSTTEIGADSAADSTSTDTAITDSGTADSTSTDTAITDSGTADSTSTDTAITDSGTADSTSTDTATTDATGDAPPPTKHVGEACAADTECVGAGGGAGGYCSSDFYAAGPLSPAATCLAYGTGLCTPTDDTTIHFCDGTKGLCLDLGGVPSCKPLCEFDATGAFSTSCVGKTACVVESYADLSGSVAAVGQCLGGCVNDSDCPTGNKCDPNDRFCYPSCTTDANCASAWGGSSVPANWKCDTTRGACTFKFTKNVGDTCTSASDCNCFKGSATSGYCTKSCRTGTAAECPTGFTCDAWLPKPSGTTPGFSAQPPGLLASCMKNCTTNTDCPTGQICDSSAGVTQKTCRPG